MNILLASSSGDGGWFVYVLIHEGHKVTWTIGRDKYREVLAGLIPPPLEGSVENPESFDLIVFDTTGHGEAADSVRAVTPVIGDSVFADKLEHDRIFGVEFMERCHIPVPRWEAFDDPADGIRWIRKYKSRSVFKPCGNRDDCSLTYVAKSAEDMERYLEVLFNHTRIHQFILQEFVAGTEVSTEAWFNGEEFYALNHTLEEKKFMAGGVGPNTGCSGNVVWMPVRPTPLFEQGVGRTKRELQQANYVGPLDLNTIVTDGNLFGLEFTPRIGYEGTCNLTRLLPMNFGEFLHAIAASESPVLGVAKHNFAATIRVTVPPYPNPAIPGKYEGIPVNGIDLRKIDEFYLSDVRIRQGSEEQLETLGMDGLIGAPIGVSETMKGAFEEVKRVIGGLLIPDLQWRVDVPRRCEERYEALLRGGWLRRLG